VIVGAPGPAIAGNSVAAYDLIISAP
jgi:hypothetical protein